MNHLKEFPNYGKNITIRNSWKNGCWIVELIYNGCVICYWQVRKIDWEDFPELVSVHRRLVDFEYEWRKESFMYILQYWQDLAEASLKFK